MEDLIKRLKVAIGFALCYLLIVNLSVGWREDHTFILGFVSSLLLLHKYTYRAVLVLIGFLLWLIIYDAIPAVPNYTVNPVHIIEPYNLELWLFGIEDNGTRVIPSVWFATRTTDLLSLIAGFSYILWMPLPMLYTGYLFFNDKKDAVNFSLVFFLTCFIGIIGYYLYPAAPPWYYINYGAATDFTISGSEGLLSEFDRIVGSPVFNGIYAKGSNVFCAIPSLHCAYPMLCLLFAFMRRNKVEKIVFFLWAMGTWFAAVYSQHHYIIDVIFGLFCAILAFGIMKYVLRTVWYRTFLDKYIAEIES